MAPYIMKPVVNIVWRNGFGNQLFMYAHAFALAKEIKYDLLIDNTSGYSKKKK